MSLHSLRLVAARYALGMATTDELVDSADRALNDGVYSYSLGELGTFRNPTWADCSPLFVAALRELHLPIPNPDVAIAILAELHIVRLVEGVVTPQEALNALYSLERDFRPGPWPGISVSPGALKPLRPFVERYYTREQYENYAEYRAARGLPPQEDDNLDKFDAGVISFAEEWCRTRWGPAVNPSWLTSTVVALARGVVLDKAFDRLPILADALQDAGCENEEILDHLRQDGPHARCCFVVDLLLGLDLEGTHP